MDKLAAMQVLVRVAKAGSFSEVARQMNVASSSVSRQVMLLERQLGAQLLNRTTRQLSLTEAGREYLKRAERVLRALHDADDAVARFHSSPRGTIRLNVPRALGRYVVAPLIPSFLERYPDLGIQFTMEDRFVDLVAERVDLAIRVGGLNNATHIARRLFHTKHVLCASPAYLERGEPISKPDDLTSHNCLAWQMCLEGPSCWRVSGPEGEHELLVSGNLTTNSEDAVLEAARSGLGITLLPDWVVAPHLRDGSLQPVLPEYVVQPADMDTSVYAVYPGTRHVSTKVRVLIDFLVEVYSLKTERPVDMNGASSPWPRMARHEDRAVRSA